MKRPSIADLSATTSLRGFSILLAVVLFPLAGLAVAEDSPAQQPAPSSPTESSTETAPDPGAESQDCPGDDCGGGQGKGKRAGRGGDGRPGQGEGCQGCQGRGHGGGAGGAARPEAQVIHFLIENHESLERTVEEIPGGVRTRTVSTEPEIIDAVRTHVRQMVDLIHGGGRIRNWDPLFREIFAQREAIVMEIQDIEGGVEVVETSKDAEVVKLIRAHAVKVEEFVARGIEAYREETPIPEDYTATGR